MFVAQRGSWPQVIELDARHPVAFPVSQKPAVWVMARCDAAPDVVIPDDAGKKLSSVGGYMVKRTEGLFTLPAETSHKYIESAAKMKIAASLVRKGHKKVVKKTPKICADYC